MDWSQLNNDKDISEKAEEQRRQNEHSSPTVTAPLDSLGMPSQSNLQQQQQQGVFLDPLHTHAMMVAAAATGSLGQGKDHVSQVSSEVTEVNTVANNNIGLSSNVNTGGIPMGNLAWIPTSNGNIPFSIPQTQMAVTMTSQPLLSSQSLHHQHPSQNHHSPRPLHQQQQNSQQKSMQMQGFYPSQQTVNAEIIQPSIIVTGPNGQPMILNQSAAASLFDSQKKSNVSSTPISSVTMSQANLLQHQQQFITPSQKPQVVSALGVNQYQLRHHPQLQQQQISGISSITNTSTSTSNAQATSSDTAGVGNKRKRTLEKSKNQHEQQQNLKSSSKMLQKSDDDVFKHDMNPEEKRRYERNLREQQRSHRISQQIKELRSVLTESKVQFKPNKYSILMSVSQYIRQLQNRSKLLDNEMKKLLNTIRQSSEMANSAPTSNKKARNQISIGNDADMLFVQGIDFKAIFEQASIAFGIASLDGKFLKCNSKFKQTCGYTRDELEKQNIFTMLEKTEIDDAYQALGRFLREESPLKHDTNEPRSAKALNTEVIKEPGTSNSTIISNSTETKKQQSQPQVGLKLDKIINSSETRKEEEEQQQDEPQDQDQTSTTSPENTTSLICNSNSSNGYWSGRLRKPKVSIIICKV